MDFWKLFDLRFLIWRESGLVQYVLNCVIQPSECKSDNIISGNGP